MSISTVDRGAVRAPYASEAVDGGAMLVTPHMLRGSENYGGASLDHGTLENHGTSENDGTHEDRGTHDARRTCFHFAESMAPHPFHLWHPTTPRASCACPCHPASLRRVFTIYVAHVVFA